MNDKSDILYNVRARDGLKHGENTLHMFTNRIDRAIICFRSNPFEAKLQDFWEKLWGFSEKTPMILFLLIIIDYYWLCGLFLPCSFLGRKKKMYKIFETENRPSHFLDCVEGLWYFWWLGRDSETQKKTCFGKELIYKCSSDEDLHVTSEEHLRNIWGTSRHGRPEQELTEDFCGYSDSEQTQTETSWNIYIKSMVLFIRVFIFRGGLVKFSNTSVRGISALHEYVFTC